MQKIKTFLIILLAAIVGGGTSTLSKIASASVPPVTFNFLRFFFAILILLPFFPFIKEKINLRNWKKITGISLVAFLNPFLFMVGVKYTTAMMGQMIYLALPLVTMIFAYIINHEAITKRKIIGIAVGLIGALIIILQPGAVSTIQFMSSLIGNVIIFIGLCSYAMYSVLIKKFQNEHSPLELNMYFMVSAFTTSMIFLPVDFILSDDWWNTATPKLWMAILYVGVMGTGIYYLLMQHAIKSSSALVASTVLYIQPIFSFIWASALLGEHLTTDLIVGGMLTLVGIALIMREKQSEKAII